MNEDRINDYHLFIFVVVAILANSNVSIMFFLHVAIGSLATEPLMIMLLLY